jgi:cell division transport system permease protein
MKYVGATDRFIYLPFVIEGIVIGIMAAMISLLILGAGYTFAIDYLRNEISIVPLQLFRVVDFKSIAMNLFVGFAAIGTAIGILGGRLFVRKYLRV